MVDDNQDYYELLQVPLNADNNAIKKAYQQLAMKYHPDRNDSPEAEQKFKDIAKAYAILSDPRKRAQYDARGHAGVAHFTDEDLFSGINFGELFGADGIGFGTTSIFDSLFRRGFQKSKRGENLRAHLLVPLERIDKGGEEIIRVTHPCICEKCKGTGAESPDQVHSCDVCNGTGKKIASHEDREDGTTRIHFQTLSVCSACNGRGVLIDNACRNCEGRGQIDVSTSIKVSIPIGLKEGVSLRIQGQGLPSEDPEGIPGDLLVTVESATDSRFERIGHDLLRQEEVPFVDLVLGTRISVPTLYNKTDIKIPPGTQIGQVFRLKSKGLSKFGQPGKGDLNVVVKSVVPENLSAKEKTLYEKLRRIQEH